MKIGACYCTHPSQPMHTCRSPPANGSRSHARCADTQREYAVAMYTKPYNTDNRRVCEHQRPCRSGTGAAPCRPQRAASRARRGRAASRKGGKERDSQAHRKHACRKGCQVRLVTNPTWSTSHTIQYRTPSNALVVAKQGPQSAIVPTAGGGTKHYVPSAQLSRRIASKWPRPVWHPPWKCYRVISGHLGCVAQQQIPHTSMHVCTNRCCQVGALGGL